MIKRVKCPYCSEKQEVCITTECGKCKKKYLLVVKDYGMYSHLDHDVDNLE